MRVNRMIAVGIVAVSTFAVVPAQAETQTVDASISSSISMSTSPTASISSWTLAPTGANTTSGGSVGVTANTPYVVTLLADKTRMTEYDTTLGAYVATTPKALSNPLAVSATVTSGAGTPVGALSVGTSAASLVTGLGLGTDVYALTLSQPTAITDAPLPAGRSYHISLTYTASAPI